MKNVLIVDATPMLREFLSAKLSAEKVHVETADSQRDGVARLLSDLPDLVILNVAKDSLYDFLDKKRDDVNAKKIPMIMTGPKIDKDEVADLVPFGVIKYFEQPVKFDVFFEAIGRVLRMPFTVDDTPCVLDIHLNKDIIFIEIARGLNHEKLIMLRYKLSEIIEKNKLAMPKVILMLSSLNLSFVDGYNLELLFKNITSDNRILKKNIKVLSLDSIVKEFIEGHLEFHGIEVVESLSDVLNSVVEGNVTDDAHKVIADALLASGKDETVSGALEFRFSSDSQDSEKKTNSGTVIALVDTNPSSYQPLSKILQSVASDIQIFTDGAKFVQSLSQNHYDIAIMELYLPSMNGFQILQLLLNQKINLDVIVYSQMAQKEYIMQALRLGAKSYIIKPQKPEVVFQKVVEILNAKG